MNDYLQDLKSAVINLKKIQCVNPPVLLEQNFPQQIKRPKLPKSVRLFMKISNAKTVHDAWIVYKYWKHRRETAKNIRDKQEAFANMKAAQLRARILTKRKYAPKNLKI